MEKNSKWVVEFSRVSSKRKTNIFSVVFAVSIVATSGSFLSSAGKTIASDITADKVFEMTNESRAEGGESALVVNAKLTMAAEAKAEDMFANNYFSHTSPAGKTPWVWIQKEDYDYTYAGENLAMDFSSAEKMEEAWMASPTHRANILNDRYREIGAAVKEGSLNGHETTLAVVMFGSGNKNISSASETKPEIAKPAETAPSADKENRSEKNIPMLPESQEKKYPVVHQSAEITSPQPGSILSGSEIKIIGRATPGENVTIFDNGNFVGSALADLNGWFSTSENKLFGGKHTLALQQKNIAYESVIEFYVDQEKPSVDFRLYADVSSPSRFFLEARADKKNCTFQFDGEARRIAEGRKAVFPVDSGQSSAILRVVDEAGNKNFKQINIANYYSGDGKNDMPEKLASLILEPGNAFADDSGRDAIKNNLGIAPHQFLASRIMENK